MDTWWFCVFENVYYVLGWLFILSMDVWLSTVSDEVVPVHQLEITLKDTEKQRKFCFVVNSCLMNSSLEGDWDMTYLICRGGEDEQSWIYVGIFIYLSGEI